MIEQLITLVSTFWYHILPFYVVNEYEQALTLRLGKYHKTYGAGLHFKIPFVDEVMTESVVTDTYNIPPQALTTKDNKEIVVSAVVKFSISDLKKFKLEITDEESAIQDVCMGVVRASLTSKTWEDCQDKKVDTYLTSQVKAEISQYGILVEKVRLTDMTKAKAFRIFGDNILE